MAHVNISQTRRGRPPKIRNDAIDTRELILRTGLEVLTEKGSSAVGIDEILKKVDVPKGSFYHYFESKEAFGLELISLYGEFFARKLERNFENKALSPLGRIKAFIRDAKEGMARFNFSRGCLIGNLGQEMGSLPESFRSKLIGTFNNWQDHLAGCLLEAQAIGELSKKADVKQLSAFFWIGWEGAVLRAKLEHSEMALDTFTQYFFEVLAAS